MIIKTRVDQELLDYYHTMESNPYIEEKDIQKLLNAYRVKFGVDLVFVSEMQVDDNTAVLTHVSFSEKKYNYSGNRYDSGVGNGENQVIYDEEGLCNYGNIGLPGKESAYSILQYGIFRNEEYDGSVGIVDFHGGRSWTSEERAAVQKLGRVLRCILYMDRMNKINAADREKINNQSHALEAFFATTDCGIIRHTVNGAHVLSINRAALNMLSYESQDELMAEGFDLIAASVVKEDKEKLRERIRKLKKVGDSTSVDYRVQHRDGEVLNVMGRIKLLEEDGELIYQRFLLDCTAQKSQEKKEKMKQKRLIEDSYEIIAGLSSDYDFIALVNSESGRMSVYKANNSSPEVISALADKKMYSDAIWAYSQYVDINDRDRWLTDTKIDHILQQLEDKNIYNVNIQTNVRDKTEYIQFSFTRVGGHGHKDQIVLAKRVITEIVEKEIAQRIVVEEALAQAERANKAKSTFLSNMSHDIRTPMNAIIGFTTLATAHIDHKERVREYLGKIMASGNHLLSLINDVLDMSRIESGKITIEEKPCSLPEILHELRNILQADIHAKQLELCIDTVDVLNEEIYCDRLRLNQILLNLLSNAVKFTSAGGTITMRIIEKAGAPKGYGSFEFHIRDTGIGMSEEFLLHIFEPFERERNSTISGIQGTGLGMAITKNIVDMMKGSIEVKSELGTGTEFIVSLTFRLQTETKEAQIIPEWNGRRALVVDDDFNTCDSVSGMLQQIGMRAEWTLSGKEAVLRTKQAVKRNDAYGIYMIDWLMPDMNGIEVTRRIRMEAGEDVPVIVLTAYDWSDIEDEAKEAGVTAFCSKPLFASELRGCLESIVRPDRKREDDNKKYSNKLRSGRILLVEDNEINQEIAAEILDEAGFETEIAENGQIAVDMLKKSGPGYYQLVLMDIQMPVMNEYEATRAIRKLKNKELSSVPILAMTANAFEEDRQAALDCGMNGHIAKPIDIDNMFRVLDEVLENNQKK